MLPTLSKIELDQAMLKILDDAKYEYLPPSFLRKHVPISTLSNYIPITHRFTATLKTPEYIRQELGVQHLVKMNEHHTCNTSESIGTHGLGGCTCAVAFKGEEVFLGHYGTLHHDKLNEWIEWFNPDKLFVFAKREYKENNGTYTEVLPNISVGTKFNPTIVPYSGCAGDSLFNNAVIVKNGTIKAFNQDIQY